MRDIDMIILHYSKSAYGNVATVRKWHTDPQPDGNGWNDIGYHYVILNGYPEWTNLNSKKPLLYTDGKIEVGRPIEQAGAHTVEWDKDGNFVKNYNHNSIGICLIGEATFTSKQIWAVRSLVFKLREEYGPLPLFGHEELAPYRSNGKPNPCPNLSMDFMRNFIPLELNERSEGKNFIGPIQQT